jgi:phage-related baseplate assembly protein
MRLGHPTRSPHPLAPSPAERGNYTVRATISLYTDPETALVLVLQHVRLNDLNLGAIQWLGNEVCYQ